MTTKISAFPTGTTLDGTELVPILQDDGSGNLINVTVTAQDIANLAPGGSGGAGLAGVNDQTGTSYTLAPSDADKDVRCTNASAVALNIDTQANSGITIGFTCLFSQGGAGTVTATALAGVTLRAPNGAATTAQYDVRGLEYLGSNEWRVL